MGTGHSLQQRQQDSLSTAASGTWTQLLLQASPAGLGAHPHSLQNLLPATFHPLALTQVTPHPFLA